MTPERWQQVKQIFHAALELAPGQRAAFVDQQCAGDTELRQMVAELLNADQAASDTLKTPAWSADSTPELNPAETMTALLGKRIGPYKLVRELGRGGMGAVYLGERADGQFRLPGASCRAERADQILPREGRRTAKSRAARHRR